MAEQVTYFIKKVKVQEAGHGAAAWKIAYADFVTAMMAFFLLMWLLTVVNTQTLKSISNYFSQNTTSGPSGADGIFKGKTANTPGIATTPMHEELDEKIKGTIDSSPSQGQSSPETYTDHQGPISSFQNLQQSLQQSIKTLPIQLQTLFPTVSVTDKEDGKIIHILNNDKNPMFLPNSANLTIAGVRLLKVVSFHLKKINYPIDIIGIVPSAPNGTAPEDNWKLSLMRASTVLKMLQSNGIDEKFFYTLQVKQGETQNNHDAINIFVHKNKKNVGDHKITPINSSNNLTPPPLDP